MQQIRMYIRMYMLLMVKFIIKSEDCHSNGGNMAGIVTQCFLC